MNVLTCSTVHVCVCRCLLYNNAQAKGYVDAWFMQAVRPFSNLIQITGHNRARQRDKWGHILEEMSALQEEVMLHLAYTDHGAQ